MGVSVERGLGPQGNHIAAQRGRRGSAEAVYGVYDNERERRPVTVLPLPYSIGKVEWGIPRGGTCRLL